VAGAQRSADVIIPAINRALAGQHLWRAQRSADGIIPAINRALAGQHLSRAQRGAPT